MGRYDVLLEQENQTKKTPAPVTGQVAAGASQRAEDAPPTPTESPTHPPAASYVVSVPAQPVASTPERANARTLTRTPERPPKRRIITRNSFEIYEDQMEALRKLAYEEKMEGGVGSMSRMVRDAIDHYLTTNKPAND